MLFALGGCCSDTLYFFVTSGLLRMLHAMYIWEFRLYPAVVRANTADIHALQPHTGAHYTGSQHALTAFY